MAVLVFTITEPNINLDLVDRFIALAEDANLEILICINKIDLLENDEFLLNLFEIYGDIGYNIIGMSTFDDGNKFLLEPFLENKTSVLAGPSGVGKSSIVNLFYHDDKMEIGSVSRKTSRGRHTTRHAELLKIKEDSYIVDSPGFTSVDILDISLSDLPRRFREFDDYFGNCRFKDCNHINEPDCAIKNQIGITVNEARYNRYVSFYNEIKAVKTF